MIKTKNKSDPNSFKALPLKYEIYRKLTHLIVLGIIFFYFTLGFLVQNLFVYLFEILPEFLSELFFSVYYNIDDQMIFTQYLVVCLVGISLIGFFTAEFVRILKPTFYPLKPVNKILREKERHMRLGPHISMGIGCFSIIIIYGLIQPIGPLIICTSMTMAIFGDMTSNLFGRTYGRNKIRNTNKTYEGLIAGAIVAFISGIIVLSLLNGLYFLRIQNILFLSLIGALIVGILDYLDLEVDDNLTYNFVISSVLFFFSFTII
ncbi:MAG: phosphatidate cytidylyltransferase [Candidatus Hodarchaeota archaeon]